MDGVHPGVSLASEYPANSRLRNTTLLFELGLRANGSTLVHGRFQALGDEFSQSHVHASHFVSKVEPHVA
jgi:hypothetical protein